MRHNILTEETTAVVTDQWGERVRQPITAI